MELTRRQLVGSVAGAAGLLGVSRPGRAQTRGTGSTETATGEAQIQRRFVVPEIQAFVGNYVGQFLFIDEATPEGPQNVDVSTCPVADWSEENTRVYSAQLLDRRQEEPLAVDIEAFGNAAKPRVTPGTFFIIGSAGQCGGDYVGLACESVRRRSLVGKPPGPTVTESGGQPGFGWLGGAAGLAGAVALAGYRRLR